ncbi:MAG: hypothetical protein U0X91_27515 [Spirosomataceae bacterium]
MPKIFIVIFLCLFIAPLSLWAQPEAKSEHSPDLNELLRKLIEQRVNDLQEYISIIGNKDLSIEQRQQAIELAVSLFEKDYKVIEKGKEERRSPYVQFSRRDGTVGSVTVRSYFNNLLSIKFNPVEIMTYDLVVLADIEKQNNDYYYTTATYFRQFKGFKAAKLIYGSKDRKNIRMTVESMNVNKTPEKDDLKIVFGDIRVRVKQNN